MDLPTLAAAKKAEKTLDLSKVMLFGPSAVAIIVSFLVGFFVVWPKFGEVQQLKTTNETLRETAVKLETKAEALSALDKAKLRTQLVAAEQLLPSEKGIFTFITQIENVRNSSGVVITNLSVGSVGQFSASGTTADPAAAQDPNAAPAPVVPSATTPADAALGDVSQVTMKVTLTSDFDQIFRFLNELYALPRVTTVGGLTFSIDQGGLIGTNMDINSLWQERPKELPSVEAPVATLAEEEVALLSRVETGIAVAPPVEVPDVPIKKQNIFSPN